MNQNGVKIKIMNQRGQAAIFIALMFNVLFIFFAMAINVALVVHDKINLQNSVDLASYYAAMKQAEVLNAIAHENYQIRQSWKLLAWRYHVLGTMGLDQAPAHPTLTGELSDEAYGPAVEPSLCIVYKPTWVDVPTGEDLCKKVNLQIPPLPKVSVIAGFLGINYGIAALSEQLRQQFDFECGRLSAYNWWFAMSIMHAFRLDQRDRMRVIYALAQDLSGGQNGDFVDLDGNSVLQGARETFLKNLTYANRQAFLSSGGVFQMMNSMQGIDPKQWLVPIQIVPTMLYTDTNPDPNQGCNAVIQPITNLPARSAAREYLEAPIPQGLGGKDLEPWAQADSGFLQDSDYQFSLGVEKNPWYMAYMGVHVKVSPREIFFPFGSSIDMVARGFAKPFGGRIGPWYSSKWDHGAKNSTGALTDPLVAPRMDAGGLLNDPNDPRRLPNYSRFPGDTLGLESKLALNALQNVRNTGIKFQYYYNIKEDLGTGHDNDILAWDGSTNQAPEIRNYEISAITPDLFDITYYSIEPDFSANYLPKIIANKTKLGIPSDMVLRGDLGGNGQTLSSYNVQQQMALAKQKGFQRREAYYFVRDKVNLLTAWLPGPGGFNYDVQQSMANFGKCALPDDKLKYKTPGSCAAGGGRTGYSVKMVARDDLLSSQQKIGGSGAAPNSILNPPSSQDGW